MSTLATIDAAIERASASAKRLEQAHRNSIATVGSRQREQQRASAEQGAAIVADLRAARDDVAQLLESARRLRGLRRLAGYVEDGSAVPVTIQQDDASRTWLVSVDRSHAAHGDSFTTAIDAAIARVQP